MSDDVLGPIAAPSSSGNGNGTADTRPTVLIADDSAEIRQLVEHRLRGTFCVVQAPDGRAALEQFTRHQVSVVLLDMDMPIMDGYTAAAAIRRREDGRSVPIIAMTGDEGAEARRRAASAGCSAYLTKPASLAAIVAAVDAAVRPGASADVASAGPGSEQHSHVPLEIDPLLADLVPVYVEEKRRQVGELRRLIADDNMEPVIRMAHDLKGTGASFGIPDVTRIGRALEAASRDRNFAVAGQLVNELDRLLARVQQQLGS